MNAHQPPFPEHISPGKPISLARLLFFIGVLVSICWALYFIFETITLLYPIQYREGAAQVMTQILLMGGNPFSLAHQPLGMNNYGLAYSLVVYPFAAVYGNTLAVYRIVTFFFLICIFSLIFVTISKNNTGRLFALACGALVLITLAGRGGIGAIPSAMGTFLFLLAILIPYNRRFDRASLLISALISILAYYTKPYFVLSFGIVASYVFLFVSKKKGLGMGLAFGVTFAACYLFVRQLCDLYFVDTFLSNLDNDTGRSFSYLYPQLIELVKEFYPVLILSMISVMREVGRLRAGHGLKPSLLRLNVPSLDQPLVSLALNYFAYVFLCSMSAFVFILGPHPQYMVYAYQLIVPPFCLWLFQTIKPSARFDPIAASLILFNILILSLTLLNPTFLSQKSSGAWARLYEDVTPASRILNSPVIASVMVERGMVPVDSGQTEYFYDILAYPHDQIWGPDYDLVKSAGLLYQEAIIRSVENRDYDKVILTKGGWLYNLTYQTLIQHYNRTDTILVRMPEANQHWSIEVWEPNGN